MDKYLLNIATPVYDAVLELTNVYQLKDLTPYRSILMKAIEHLFLEVANSKIRSLRSHLINDNTSDGVYSREIYSISQQYELDYWVLHDFFIDDCISFNSFLNSIVNIIEGRVNGSEFDIWTIVKVNNIYVLEYLGDYRILEWEKDHLVDGRYR